MMRETEVAGCWEKIARKGAVLQTVDEKPVQILYPGRLSDEPGADYLDAVVNIGNETQKGNIEVHVHTRDWQAHGHHHDPAYNNIVLHVVAHHNGDATTPCQNGRTVPVVCLETVRPPGIRPRKCRLKSTNIGAMLDNAGDIRFGEKSDRFKQQLTDTEPGQVLYEGLMAALGYSRNQEAFRTIARNMPLHVLEERPADAEALLLAAGGFLSLKDRKYPFEIPDYTFSNPPAWKLFRIRPANYPPRRLAAMASLLAQCRPQGLLNFLEQKMADTPPDAPETLENTLMVLSSGYWENHFDIGRLDVKLGAWLIGQTTARIMVINTILPYFANFGEKAAILYRFYPVSEENTVERHMKRQLELSGKEVNSSRRQQGLLHLYKNYCTQGGCGRCPLTRPAVSIPE
ncbi:MAG TPA: DUF2851 family protein [Dehalococcoidales bacterium]|nr:DUF2851 family protein [Dehalococcoidales bacterium]